MVLEERGVATEGRNGEWMRNMLGEFDDFKNETSMIERMLIEKGHIPCFLPKVHPELNPIERVWARLKRYTRANCKYSFSSLRKNIPLAYDSVTWRIFKTTFERFAIICSDILKALPEEKNLTLL